ncbi:MAG TPA: preprotein translocase subunit SecE [bacterium]|nr:preprotein translocase subunit SecE [bacterium]
MGKFSNYIKESIAEIKKVTWPTKKETYRYSFLVIAISLLVAIVLGGFDYIFNLGLKSLMK